MNSKKQILQQWLRQQNPLRVEAADFEDLRRQLAPVSEGYLRRLLRASGTPLSPLVEGVVQDTFANLERTLLRLTEAYEQEPRARRLVVQAKDHAKLALRRDPDPAIREEKILWMMEWLENPPAFPLWLTLRKRVTGTRFLRP